MGDKPLGVIGNALALALGAVFGWLVTRHIDPGEAEKAWREMEPKWLAAGV